MKTKTIKTKTKTIKLICLLLGIISMSQFSSCYPEDDIPDPINFRINNYNIISIENNTSSFNIDDTIIINSVVENTQTTTDGINIALSDYYADDEAKIIWYRLRLFKESNFGGLVSIPINEEYIISIEGASKTDGSSFINITSTLTDETFKSKLGVKLKETGTYYLTNSLHNSQIIISGGDYEKGIIHIYSKII